MIKEILIYKIVIFFEIKLFFDFFYKLRALNDVLIKQIRDLAIRARVYESVIFIPRKLWNKRYQSFEKSYYIVKIVHFKLF